MTGLEFKNIYEAIYESAPDGIIVVNERGSIEMVNTRTTSLFGYTKEELIGCSIETLMPERYNQVHRRHRTAYHANPHSRAMGTGNSFSGRKKNGDEFFIEISLSAVTVQNKLFILAAVRDVTEKKIVSNRLAAQDTKLKEQNTRLLNFAHVVSHNLRSYSGNMKTMLEFLENTESISDRQTLMQHLKKMANALHETVDHLSEVVTIQTTTAERENILLHQYVEKTVASLKSEIISSRAIINNRVPSETVINYNPSYLESILFNLLSNSLKYRDPLRQPKITIEYSKDHDKKMLRISDNGLGIDLKKFHSKLFNMHATFHGNSDARGLGLFITKNQVEAMNGTIRVESEPGVGTAFVIQLR
jgi:PAS domain S-box-containing protein